MRFNGIFRDRRHAGEALADALSGFRNGDALVIGLPRGGVPVAAAVASELGLDLEALVVRKIGEPGNPECAMGAIGPGGILIMNPWAEAKFSEGAGAIESLVAQERAELRRREALYRAGRPFPEVAGREIILVDDGLATGATMQAAIKVLRHLGAGRCVVAVPVAAPDAVAVIRKAADEIVSLLVPQGFRGVGQFYEDFSQTMDQEVLDLLSRRSTSINGRSAASSRSGLPGRDRKS